VLSAHSCAWQQLSRKAFAFKRTETFAFRSLVGLTSCLSVAHLSLHVSTTRAQCSMGLGFMVTVLCLMPCRLCESVATTLVGKRLGSFTRVSTAVRTAVEEAITRILTPKRSIDVLREAQAARSRYGARICCFSGSGSIVFSVSLPQSSYTYGMNTPFQATTSWFMPEACTHGLMQLCCLLIKAVLLQGQAICDCVCGREWCGQEYQSSQDCLLACAEQNEGIART
jgi:hypothetical protein